jgi:hypothetical protein
MPLVRLEVRQGRSATQKQALLDAAHADRSGVWLLNSSSRAVAVSVGFRTGK